MSKTFFIIGLAVSLIFHAWLLGFNNFVFGDKSKADEKSQQLTKIAAEVEVMENIPEQEKFSSPPPAPKQAEKAKNTAKSDVKLTEANKPKSSESETGSFAGAADGKLAASMRINWGESETAAEILEKSGMKLVILDSKLSICAQMTPKADGKWVREGFSCHAAEKYSQALRIVNNVAAFSKAKPSVDFTRGEALAVLLPEYVEKMLRNSAQIAAQANNFSAEDISTYAGRFVLDNSAVAFVVTHIQPRAIQ